MFRMGVSEYISRTHHLDQLGQVFAAYLRPAATAGVVAGTGQTGARARAEDEPATVAARAV